VKYDQHENLGVGEMEHDPAVYRERLLPLIETWTGDRTRVAIFGIGGHTDRLHTNVPELDRLRLVAYLDTAAPEGTQYRGVPVHRPTWAPGHADVVLCSSFAHELKQLEILDTIPVKAVLSHPPTRAKAPQSDVTSAGAVAAA